MTFAVGVTSAWHHGSWFPAHQAAGHLGIRCHSDCAAILVTSFGRDVPELGRGHSHPGRNAGGLQQEVPGSTSGSLGRTLALADSPACVPFPLLQSEPSAALSQGVLGPRDYQHLRAGLGSRPGFLLSHLASLQHSASVSSPAMWR